MEEFICPICNNSDIRFTGVLNRKRYCRKCLSFSGRKASSEYKVNRTLLLHLDYSLSEKQEKIARETLKLLKEKKNVLIYAVTGSGKTELVYYSIEYYLRRGLHVGFSTPRKDVVIDLLPRFKSAFPKAKIISVYQEHNHILEGDIILLTTHQLYRYTSYFDLLILDEIDAFPYKNNETLNNFFYKAIKGNYVLLSATPSKEDIKKIEESGKVLKLYERYHKADLPVPDYKKTYPILEYFQCYQILKAFLEKDLPVFIFVPTINCGKRLFFFLNLLLPYGGNVSSKEEERSVLISKFKNKELKYLVTTSILERGVTVKNLQVIVFRADSEIYTKEGLIQISGRVGRKSDAKDGKIIYLSSEFNKAMRGSIDDIKRFNSEKNIL